MFKSQERQNIQARYKARQVFNIYLKQINNITFTD